MPSDHVRQNSDDQYERGRDHDRHQLVIRLTVRVVARTLGAGRLHGHQERPPLSQLVGDLVIEEHCDDNCDFEDNRDTKRGDLFEEELACTRSTGRR